jgi:hypothetical protein
MVEDWRLDSDHHRPHSALGMMTPGRFAAGYRAYQDALDGDTLTLTASNHSPPALSHQMDQ